jgi:hypothetical protein
MRNVDQLVSKRQLLNSKKPSIRVSMVRCPENDGEEKQFIKRWSKVDAITIQRPMDWGGSVAIESHYPERQPLFACPQLFERIVILSNGDYSICCLDYEGGIHKNIRDYKLLDAFYSDPLELIRDTHLRGDIRSLRLCKNCISVHSIGMMWLIKGVFPTAYTV